ncbi:MAG TPA: hypothetical protein VIO12_09355 [Thermoanaerobaculia bacterium]
MPWHDEPIGLEVNLAFVIRNNLLYLPGATIDGHSGSFLLGSAEPQSVLDSHFVQKVGPMPFHSLQLSERDSLRFTPVILDLRGVGDGIVGADVWGSHAVTIDYRAGLLTFQREGIHPELMNVYSYRDAPSINVEVDGRLVPAIVDTSSPDTLVLPREAAAVERRSAHIQIAGTDLGSVDIRLADVARPRIGNRLLSKFLVTIDYGRRQVGLFRDPRISL